MCARFQLKPPEDWMEEFGLQEDPGVTARYNIAPTQDVLTVRLDAAGCRAAALLRWGLERAGEDGPPGGPLINARSETAATRAAFREAFKRRRCLVPATGFYEWRRLEEVRQPYLIRRRDRRAFAFAGLWEGRSCTILTTDANTLVDPIHDRMPVILSVSDYDLWLDRDVSADDVRPLLRPYAPDALEVQPVSPRMNRADVDDPECERPVSEPPPPRQGSLF
jgi:putative SOS response-associated peptidase YedK